MVIAVSSQVPVMVVPLVTGVDMKSVDAIFAAVTMGGVASHGAGPVEK